jgi:hypothetical protein
MAALFGRVCSIVPVPACGKVWTIAAMLQGTPSIASCRQECSGLEFLNVEQEDPRRVREKGSCLKQVLFLLFMLVFYNSEEVEGKNET